MRGRARSLCLLALAACGTPSQPTPKTPGWPVVTRALDSVIADSAAPGAVVGVTYRGRHWYYGTGRLGLDDATRPDSSTIYDLASLTKVIGMTTAVMIGVQEGKLVVDSPVVRYVPLFGRDSTQPVRRTVTLRHLLTHSSGLPAFRLLYKETGTAAEAFALADTTRLDTVPGARYVYSDIGAMLLAQSVEAVYHERIDSLLEQRVFGPLGMTDTRYLPPAEWLPRIAPTENDPWRGHMIRGEVHDENAARLGGVSGHAGLFSSARDLLTFADYTLFQWNLTPDAPAKCRGMIDPEATPIVHGTQSIAALAVWTRALPKFVKRQNIPPGSDRALGWDTPSATGSSAGHYFSRRSIGHTGFTGTSIWIDPDRCLAVVLLSNRVHPTRQNAKWGPVRGLIADRVVEALGEEGIKR
ncbi:MAG: serine hydrolase domain-containing protein [Gemmatimonadales bacterium]